MTKKDFPPILYGKGTTSLTIIGDFSRRYPRNKPTPHFSKVKKEYPKLFVCIMDRFGGYRSFLRRIKRPMPRTSAKERAFIRYSSNVSLNYFKNNWSSLEELTWCILEYLDMEEIFVHNFSFPSPKGSYYKIDFFSLDLLARIEVDGIFHSAIPKQAERDKEKDDYFSKFGIVTLHLTSEDFKDLRIVTKKVLNFFNNRLNLYKDFVGFHHFWTLPPKRC